MICNHMYVHYPYYPNFYVNQQNIQPITVYSQKEPACGQKNRSSNNFRVVSSGNYGISAPNGVTFNVYLDRLGPDKTIKKGAKSGDVVSLDPGNNYYIANPQGATTGFNVTFSPQ